MNHPQSVLQKAAPPDLEDPWVAMSPKGKHIATCRAQWGHIHVEVRVWVAVGGWLWLVVGCHRPIFVMGVRLQ